MMQSNSSLTDAVISDNEFHTEFTYTPILGGSQDGVTRRDPSDIIKVDGLYYVWYTKVLRAPGVHGYPDGYSGTVWYATSPDGKTWTEQSESLGKGGTGTWDEEGVYTPNILVAENQYYLTYDGADAVKEGEDISAKPFGEGMAVAPSPRGPWKKLEQNPIHWPVDDPGRFDSFRVCDACLIVRDRKYWWYYKGRGIGKTTQETMMGVAISDSPAGPYEKHESNPLIRSGHEVLVWPYREGVVSLVGPVGPEGNTIQYAPDGLDFSVKAHVTNVPCAPGAYRPDAFNNTQYGSGVNWGISMTREGENPYLLRFECDLSLKKNEPQ